MSCSSLLAGQMPSKPWVIDHLPATAGQQPTCGPNGSGCGASRCMGPGAVNAPAQVLLSSTNMHTLLAVDCRSCFFCVIAACTSQLAIVLAQAPPPYRAAAVPVVGCPAQRSCRGALKAAEPRPAQGRPRPGCAVAAALGVRSGCSLALLSQQRARLCRPGWRAAHGMACSLEGVGSPCC